jgi:hypothetical protein
VSCAYSETDGVPPPQKTDRYAPDPRISSGSGYGADFSASPRGSELNWIERLSIRAVIRACPGAITPSSGISDSISVPRRGSWLCARAIRRSGAPEGPENAIQGFWHPDFTCRPFESAAFTRDHIQYGVVRRLLPLRTSDPRDRLNPNNNIPVS